MLAASTQADPASAAPGDLDPTFGGAGLRTYDLNAPGRDHARGVAIQSDGMIVSTGMTRGPDGTDDFSVARHSSDGSLDTTFGNGGLVSTPVVAGRADVLWTMALDKVGRILLGGSTNFGQNFALVRYLTDGSLDTTFGTGGIVVTDVVPPGPSESIRGLAIDSAGRIVASGGGGDNAIVARYNDGDGSLDTTFGTGGILSVDLGGSESFLSVALDTGGNIVGAGGGTPNGDLVVGRVLPDGTMDPTFGTGGFVTTDLGGTSDDATDVAIQSDGKIVAAGSVGGSRELTLTRYNPDGSPDAGFGSGGIVSTPSITRGGTGIAGLVIQEDGKLVAGGVGTGLGNDFAVARYNPGDGSLDTSFGGGDGIVLTDFAASFDYTGDLALQPDGNIVAAGRATDAGGNSVAGLVRYKAELAESLCGISVDNVIHGTSGDDTIVGTAGRDLIFGKAGNDTISGGDGKDCILGGLGDDNLRGDNGNDRLFGEAGNDTLAGKMNDDRLTGGAGVDAVIGGYGRDTIFIAAGDVPAAQNETLNGKADPDTLTLGTGVGTADISAGAPPSPFTVTDPSTGGTYSVSKVEQTIDN